MAETKKYYHNLDVDNNKVINPLLNPLTTAQRTAVGGLLTPLQQGYVCYDTDLNQQFFWDGVSWITTMGTTTWGSITGTITDQTDLINYLIGNYYPLSSNPAGYLTSFTEIDPIYTASSWYSTVNNSANWNTAYSWGNHALAGYLTSYTETDPVFTAWLATPPNISIFNNNAGYLTSATLPVPTLQQVTTAGNTTTDEIIIQDGVVLTHYRKNSIYRENTSTGDDASINFPPLYNQNYTFPNQGGYIPITVNGNYADINGNIVVPTGSTSTLQQVTDIGNTVYNPALDGYSQLLFNNYTIYDNSLSTSTYIGMDVDYGTGNPRMGVYNLAGDNTSYFATGVTIDNRAVFFATDANLQIGSRVNIKGTVKAHREESLTQLNRVKILEVL